MNREALNILTYVKGNISYFQRSKEKLFRWFKNGLLHREDGPAYIDHEHPKETAYMINGRDYASKSTWARAIKRIWSRERSGNMVQ